MIGQTISHYKIFEKIGKGGMGVVYKAHDINLERMVALKFLPYEFTQDDELIQRFINEAKIASSLQHDNICTVHEIGESDDDSGRSKFICMDYYEGETVKEKLEGGIENLTNIKGILLQTAKGLIAAHEKGITHRDIKPSNIFVTNKGTVKILDFGLAKGMNATQLTKLGTTAGTVSYMSPEQLTGDNVDNRTDIWSYGVVMFEMLCGERPFTGEIDHAIIYSIINEDPDWKLLESAGVDEKMKNIVLKCLEKNPGNRYQSINKLLSDLNSVVDPSSTESSRDHNSDTFRKSFIGKLLQKKSIMVVSAMALIIIFYLIWPGTVIDDDMRIAVFPINYDGNDQSQKSICNGLPGHLTGQLRKIGYSSGFRDSGRRLSVVPQHEVINSGVKTSEEARDWFDVNYTISITVQFYDNIIEARIELINAKTTELIRSETVIDSTVNRKIMQDKLAFTAAGLLNISEKEIEIIPSGGVTNNEGAYEEYLKAVGYLSNFELINNINSAIFYFQRAIQIDTNYAAAYAGLAEAYYRKYKNEKRNEWADSSIFYSQKALRKDDTSYESHISLGMVYSLKGLYGLAIIYFEKAIAIEMYSDDAYRELANVYNLIGNLDLAEKYIKKAIKINPDNWVNYNYLGNTYYDEEKLNLARVQFKKVLELRPRNVKGLNNLGGIYFQQEKFDSSFMMAQKSIDVEPNLDGYYLMGIYYYYQQNYADAAGKFLEATKFSEEDYELWGNLGESLYWSGKTEESIQYYRKAIKYCELSLEVNPKDTYKITNLAGYYSRIGEREKAIELNQKAIRYGITDEGEMYTVSVNFEGLGDRDNAIKWISKAIEGKYPLAEIERYPGFENLRKDERYRRLVDNPK